MDCDIRKQPNGTQLSFQLPQQAYSPAIYPIIAPNGSTIVLYGHERGLNTLRLHEVGTVNGSDRQSQELDEEDAIPTKLEPWIDIDIDSPVTRVAVPSVQSTSNQIPDFLRTNLVVVVACADSSLRLITFPLALDAHGKRTEIRITTIPTFICHSDLITSLVFSWLLEEYSDDQNATKPRSHEDQLYFLIASASATGGGLLAYHGINLKSHLAGDDANDQLLVKQFIQAPLLGSTLAFCHNIREPMKYPLLLLTSPAHGLVHILALDDRSSSMKRRRGEDTGGTPGDALAGLSLRIILSLYAPYQGMQVPARRQSVLDAKWVGRGTGMVAIFEDGGLGIWDLGSLDTKSNMRGSKVRASTSDSFRVIANLGVSTQSKKSTGQPVVDGIAAITPHTRKIRSAALFGDQKASVATQSKDFRPVGHITICDNQNTSLINDTLILSYNGNNFYVPTLKPYLDTDSKSYEKRLQTLPSIRLGGERQLCICNRRLPSKKASAGLLGAMTTRPDLLLVTNSRLILHNNASLQSALDSSALQLPLRSIGSKETSFISRMSNDEILDVDAMDQILERMENIGGDNEQMPSFTMNTTMQVDELFSPLGRTASGAKFTIEGQHSTARRKLFG